MEKLKGLIDTNILVDYLKGEKRAKQELSLYEEPAISLITWMEILIGAEEKEQESLLRSFLHRFRIIEINQDIAERAVILRRTHHIKIPDALIWATAQFLGCLFVTRNSRDFPKNNPLIRIPYS